VTDRDFDNYLALLSGMLRLRRSQRTSIAGELRDHLIEHVAHLESTGISHEEAVRKALEEFGDAAALAANFSALVGMRRRRLIMRCTIGTTVVMTGLVVALLAFRPGVVDDPNVAQAQNNQKAGKNSDGGVAGTLPQTKRAAHPQDEDAQTRKKLAGTRMEGEFVEMPLNQVLNYLSDVVQVQFYIDKKSLAESSAAADSPTTLNLKEVPAEMVLDLVLRQHGLGYRLRNGVIMVASQADIQSQVEVRVYPVPEQDAQELAALIPATIDTNNWREHTVTTGGGSQMRLPPGVGYGASRSGYGRSSPEPASTETIGGGGAGTIRVYRGVLVVSQTPEVHQKIEQLLSSLESVLADRPRSAMPQPVGPHSGGPRGPGYPEALPPHAERSGSNVPGLPAELGNPYPSEPPRAATPSADRPSESPRPSVPTALPPSSPASADPGAPSTKGLPTAPNPRQADTGPSLPAETRPPVSAKS
jgi:hypothetical protein